MRYSQPIETTVAAVQDCSGTPWAWSRYMMVIKTGKEQNHNIVDDLPIESYWIYWWFTYFQSLMIYLFTLDESPEAPGNPCSKKGAQPRQRTFTAWGGLTSFLEAQSHLAISSKLGHRPTQKCVFFFGIHSWFILTIPKCYCFVLVRLWYNYHTHIYIYIYIHILFVWYYQIRIVL